jgi:hypothetical protein
MPSRSRILPVAGSFFSACHLILEPAPRDEGTCRPQRLKSTKRSPLVTIPHGALPDGHARYPRDRRSTAKDRLLNSSLFVSSIWLAPALVREEGRGKREEGRGKREEGRGKREEGRGKREEGRGKREEGTLPAPWRRAALRLERRCPVSRRRPPHNEAAVRALYGLDRLTKIKKFQGVGDIGRFLPIVAAAKAAYPHGGISGRACDWNSWNFRLTLVGLGPITRLKNAGGTAAGERKARL